MIRKLFTHTMIYGLAPHVSKFASFFVLPLVTQHLTAIDYGIYGVTTAAIGFFSVLASLGLRVVLINSYFKSPNHYTWHWRQVYGFLSLWSIPFTIISAVVLYFVIPAEGKTNASVIIALNIIPLIFFGQTATIATTYYQVQKKPLPIAVRTAIFGLLTVFLNWYTIAVLKLGHMGWFWSTFIVTMLNNISFWIPLNFAAKIKPIFNFKWRLIKNNLKVALPTVPHFYSGYLLNTSDKLLMEFLHVDAVNIGKYNVAYTFGNYFNSFGIASGFAVGPLLNECYKTGNEVKARALIFIQQVAFFALTFGIGLWMKELFTFFIRNDQLNTMYPLAIIIVMGYNYRPMYIGSNSMLLYTEKTKLLWRVSFIAGVLNVLLNLICIPLFGFESAAYTTFVCLLYMGYSAYFFKEFKQHTAISYHPFLWLTLTIGMTAFTYFAVEFDWVFKAILTVAATGIALVLIKRFNDQAK